MGHREQLLAAARQLLQDKGYAHITARDLVAASDTNLASIGYHFGSKAELLNEAISGILTAWIDDLASTVLADPDVPPLQRIVLTWQAQLDHLPEKRALFLSFVEALAQAGRSSQLRAQFAEHYRRCRIRVAELIVQSVAGEAAEEMPADDPRQLAVASFVLAVCNGLALQWLLDPDGVPTPEDLMQGLLPLLTASLGVTN
ncbi:TetR family transcriptional regulator [Jatrophihabitans sp. GAS493]|uniref:TetR/AcrR family transcriptional regulator n=1 Tax=Jatrophihabitans sp. GAS493 TaxID=1907575 RepID=UPI000BB83557|nr:TetR/AcrR family transcriptional regulator [Jatrophihabitans sp. GAS493]SOD72781.1 TetR family transcriptional regulator [Jatrophihabitans sp. GAS493]